MFSALFTEAAKLGYDRVIVVDDKPEYLQQAATALSHGPTLLVELVHVTTHPGGFETPSGITRIHSLTELITMYERMKR